MIIIFTWYLTICTRYLIIFLPSKLTPEQVAAPFLLKTFRLCPIAIPLRISLFLNLSLNLTKLSALFRLPCFDLYLFLIAVSFSHTFLFSHWLCVILYLVNIIKYANSLYSFLLWRCRGTSDETSVRYIFNRCLLPWEFWTGLLFSFYYFAFRPVNRW